MFRIIIYCIIILFISCDKKTSTKPDPPEPPETSTMIGNNGLVYKTVKIGNQWWMAENLCETQYHNGDPILHVPDNSEWFQTSMGAYCTIDNIADSTNVYGYLYNRFVLNDPRNITPPGWHIPTDEEWQTLFDYLGGSSVAGGKMKDTGTTYWQNPNAGATNESGFSALPGGYRHPDGTFHNVKCEAFFWSNSWDSLMNSSYCVLDHDISGITRFIIDERLGCSIRCVKD